MTTLTEQQLEDQLIEQLVQNNYERAVIPNVDALKTNFRKQMNRLNSENLTVTELSDKEFTRILLTIEGKSVFESAKILRDKHVLRRDDESEIYIQLFDKQTCSYIILFKPICLWSTLINPRGLKCQELIGIWYLA